MSAANLHFWPRIGTLLFVVKADQALVLCSFLLSTATGCVLPRLTPSLFLGTLLFRCNTRDDVWERVVIDFYAFDDGRVDWFVRVWLQFRLADRDNVEVRISSYSCKDRVLILQRVCPVKRYKESMA